MKKLAILIIISVVFLVGCVTTQENQSSNEKAFRPNYNQFEESDWLSITQVELYQDDDFLYLYIQYNSENDGTYSVFNPPDGSKFKEPGSIVNGEGSILQAIKKDSLDNIEGITILLFPGDFSNESSRTGLFINQEDIKWNQIPQKPSHLMVDELVIKESSSTPETAISFEEYIFPKDFLSNITGYSKQQKIYKWKGRYVRIEFIVSDNVDKFQKFIDSGDLTQEISVKGITQIVGEPLFYMVRDEVHFTKDSLPDSYTMVYTASWTDDPTASLTIDVEDGKPVILETKYYGWYQVNDISVGMEIDEIKNRLKIRGNLSREDAYARTQSEGEISINQYIVDSDMFASYTDFEKSYKVTWEKNTGTGVFIIHILLNQ